MKKLSFAIFSVLCMLCCILGTAACNKVDDKVSDKVNDNDTVVTAEKWADCFTEIANIDNATFELVTDGDLMSLMKIDGKKYYTKGSMGEIIYAKDGENYYRFAKEDASAGWTREIITAQKYNFMALNYNSTLSGYMPFKDDYSSFIYSNGKYTAATLDKSPTMHYALKNVTVTFNKNKLQSVVYNIDTDKDHTVYTLNNIGNTKISLPAKFTEADAE